MSGLGWKHRGKTYDSPAQVIEELQADLDRANEELAKANLQVGELQKEVEHLKGPCTCEHDPKHAGGACGICHAEALLALERAEQFMVTTNLKRAKARGDYQIVKEALAHKRV